MKFFKTSARNLVTYEAAAGVGHHVGLSVVGTEHLSKSGYFHAEMAPENLIKRAPIPHSIVEAKQFFEFVKSIGDTATDGNKSERTLIPGDGAQLGEGCYRGQARPFRRPSSGDRACRSAA